jgi:hypothetical protein
MRHRALAAASVVAALVVAVPFATVLAVGPDYTLGAAVTASPATSPLADPCPDQAEQPDADPPQINFKDTEVEPQIAVNPTDQNNVIGVFQEDRWSDGAAHGLVAAVSLNGGASYINNWAEFSACSDIAATPFKEPLPRATDPWVSFDANGRAYQIALSIIDGRLSNSAVTASYSTDKGLTWSTPADITRNADPLGLVFNDKQSITADPYVGGRAYATWIQGELPGVEASFPKLIHAFSFRGLPMFSKTVDGGLTWSTPKPMTNANIYAQGNQIAVLPDGTLLDVQAVLFKGAGIQPNQNAAFQAVQRSTDGGQHWSPANRIAPLSFANSEADGEPLRVGDYLPDVAVDGASGAIYVTWAAPQGGSTNKIVLSRSTDSGKTWSSPVVVSHHDSAHSFNHAVAVANDGELAVLYYDIARNDDADGIPTDVYLRHSGDGGQTWSGPQLLASFDFATAPVARGHFLGDYMGLEAIGPSDLIALFGVTDATPDSANIVSIRLSR